MADNATVVSTSTRNFPNRLGKGAPFDSEGFGDRAWHGGKAFPSVVNLYNLYIIHAIDH